MSKITTSVHLAKAVQVAKESAQTSSVQFIRLNKINDGDMEDLLWVVENTFIGEISINGCRLSSEKLNKILRAILNNRVIWNTILDVRGNYHDDESINIFCGLIHNISSLSCHNLSSNGLDKLLQSIKDSKLDVLDISGSAVNDASLSHLKELVKCRKITTKLNLEGCKGAYRPLNIDDKSSINGIYQRNKKIVANTDNRLSLHKQQNLKIKWFRYYNIPKEFVSQQEPESNDDNEQLNKDSPNYGTMDSGISEGCTLELSLNEVEALHPTPLKAEPIIDGVLPDVANGMMSHILFQKDREFFAMIWPKKINCPMSEITGVIDMRESGFNIIHPLSEFVANNPENPVSLECTNIQGLRFTPHQVTIRDDLEGMTRRNVKFRLDGNCLERIRKSGEDVDIIYTIGDDKIPICARLQKIDQQSERTNTEINVHVGDSKVSANTYTGRHGVINSTQDGVTNVANI